jgi:hypothetical protein
MRIIAFGCSYTYGHGLPDCLSDDMITQGLNHSKLAYPSKLAEKLDCDYINLGRSGNSNKEIWYDVMNFNFKKDDIAVITWTYFSRFCVIKSNSIRRITPWKEEEKLFYMNYSSRKDMMIDFYCRLNHVNLHLNNSGIKNYSFVIDEPGTDIPKWSEATILGQFEMVDKANDKCHPGAVSHNRFANNIYNEVIKSLPDKHLK